MECVTLVEGRIVKGVRKRRSDGYLPGRIRIRHTCCIVLVEIKLTASIRLQDANRTPGQISENSSGVSDLEGGRTVRSCHATNPSISIIGECIGETHGID